MKLDLLQKLTEKGIDNVDVVLLDKPGIFIDYDEEGNVVGMEILNASKRIPDPFQVEYESSG